VFSVLLVQYELLWETVSVLANLSGFSIRRADIDDPTERSRIDAFVSAQAEAEIFHRSAWLRAVERGTGQTAFYLVAEDRAGVVQGLLPLTRITSPLFGRSLVSTGFGVGGGILAASQATVDALGAAAWALAREQSCASVELRGGVFPQSWPRETGTYAGFARELPGDEAAILKSIPRKQRAEVRRALGMELDVETGNSDALLEEHYRVYCESVRNLGTPVFPRGLFEEMARAWGERTDVLVVRARGKPVAAVLSIYDRGVVHPYWGGGTKAARQLRANDLMYFALMRHAAGRGCVRFDFGRSKFGTGAFAFKKNWGFEPRRLVYARCGAARDLDPRSARHRLQVAAWRRLPLAVANRLGPPIARGLG